MMVRMYTEGVHSQLDKILEWYIGMNNDEKEIKLESIENHGCNDKIEEFIVVQNAGLDSEEIYYTGFSEIEAYRTYKRIKGGKKNIFKAYIKRDLVFNVPFIDTYEIIEVIR